MKKKVLITGSNGYLGTLLVQTLTDAGDYDICPSVRDITADRFAVPQVDAIIHLAAKPNSFDGDAAEIFSVNYQGTVNLARQCPGAHFIFLSSDYVFRSDPTRVYEEEDPTDPETVYGRSKAMAEHVLLSERERLTILRTSMLYGYDHPRRRNFFKLVERQLAEGKVLELFTDVYSRPTHVKDVCAVIQRVLDEPIFGVYHACGKEYISRYELGRLICNSKRYDAGLIQAIKKPMEVQIPQFLNLRASNILEKEIKTNLNMGVRQ